MFLFCFSRGSSLTPYSKSVPAVIAKASAIYNPIIYAIIHPRYRYSKYIGMCITVHANVVHLLHRTNYPHSFSLTPCRACSCADQAMMGSGWSDPDGTWQLQIWPWEWLKENSPSLHLSSPSEPCSALWSCTTPWLTEGEHDVQVIFHRAETATTEHSLDKRSQPARLKKSLPHPYQFKQLCMHMFKVWFSGAFFSQKILKHWQQKILYYIKEICL